MAIYPTSWCGTVASPCTIPVRRGTFRCGPMSVPQPWWTLRRIRNCWTIYGGVARIDAWNAHFVTLKRTCSGVGLDPKQRLAEIWQYDGFFSIGISMDGCYNVLNLCTGALCVTDLRFHRIGFFDATRRLVRCRVDCPVRLARAKSTERGESCAGTHCTLYNY
jgi:hypothetical protein